MAIRRKQQITVINTNKGFPCLMQSSNILASSADIFCHMWKKSKHHIDSCFRSDISNAVAIPGSEKRSKTNGW
jgi:hypothetical protein